MKQFTLGLILGFVMVLPGMSGGTVLLIFGIYERLLKDLAKLKIRPYLPLLIGTIIGIFISGKLFTIFIESYRNISLAFLLGCLLASTKSVISQCEKINIHRNTMLLFGLIIGFVSVREPLSNNICIQETSNLFILISGALSSAAMVIPGLPGSSILILLNVYDEILFYIGSVNIEKLLSFGLGSIIGMFFLVKFLSSIYDKYRNSLSYLFVGIIIGSSRALFPQVVNTSIILIFLIGFSITWVLSST
ncbi:DUF368 domain-containing protein [Serpentinicella sp. ANB-PHB4]|uniref:undecaprenyl phosphate translocase family protein n=1 Tax=Serpentinicella sp. ANB-PHB4 TaxID=3074076 RepID=UPI00285B8517|nr:DUF368 domain-containing protein [Serpentinicella sp. ANB-PHB4]MDR5658351.1 DUF368 domain-containing protein [Serpentinicella sp. ANB-PHB4]